MRKEVQRALENLDFEAQEPAVEKPKPSFCKFWFCCQLSIFIPIFFIFFLKRAFRFREFDRMKD